MSIAPRALYLQPLTHANLQSVSTDLPLLDILHGWNRTLCGCWGLAPVTQHDVLEVHPHCRLCQCFTLSAEWRASVRAYHGLFYAFICQWTSQMSPPFAYGTHAVMNLHGYLSTFA